MGETSLLLLLSQSEKTGGILEFFILDELADQLPAGIVLFHIFFRWLVHTWQECAAFEIHQIGRHHNELGCQINIEELKGIDVIEVLARDALNRDGVDVQLVLFDQVKEKIEGTFKDLQPHFVIIRIHEAVVRNEWDKGEGKFTLDTGRANGFYFAR